MNTISTVGRPRIPLLIGQRTYVEFAYRHRMKTQLDIAAKINVALPRVHRFLVERGLHTPTHHGTTAYTNTVNYAVELYVRGAPVAKILQETGLVSSELYKALHARSIPLRTRKKNARI